MYQIARIEFQKCNFLVPQGGTSTLRHLPVHASAERGTGAPRWSLPLQHPPPPSRGKAVLDLPLFAICTIHVLLFLLLFLECASRLEHVGLNKYFWHIYKVTMTCFTTRHIQRGGVRATFFNSEGAKINDSLGPPGVRPPGYAPGYIFHWAPTLNSPVTIFRLVQEGHFNMNSVVVRSGMSVGKSLLLLTQTLMFPINFSHPRVLNQRNG